MKTWHICTRCGQHTAFPPTCRCLPPVKLTERGRDWLAVARLLGALLLTLALAGAVDGLLR